MTDAEPRKRRTNQIPPFVRITSAPFLLIGVLALLYIRLSEPPTAMSGSQYHDLYQISYDVLYVMGSGAVVIGCISTLYIASVLWTTRGETA